MIITNITSTKINYYPLILRFFISGVDLHQQGAALKSFSRKKKDINYGKAVSTNSLQAESISVAKVNPEGLVRDRRTIEEIQQVGACCVVCCLEWYCVVLCCSAHRA